jgi:CheY-like chemotaxis protein
VTPLRVLVVDDSEIVRDIVAALFEAGGHRVKTAGGPAEVEIGAADDIDVVLVDLSFPRPEIEALARALRERNAKAKLVVFSDKPDPVLQQAATSIGADGWLRKSTGPDLVAHVVRTFTPA